MPPSYGHTHASLIWHLHAGGDARGLPPAAHVLARGRLPQGAAEAPPPHVARAATRPLDAAHADGVRARGQVT
eukprot:4662105-Prymnesium_polylepis.1